MWSSTWVWQSLSCWEAFQSHIVCFSFLGIKPFPPPQSHISHIRIPFASHDKDFVVCFNESLIFMISHCEFLLEKPFFFPLPSRLQWRLKQKMRSFNKSHHANDMGWQLFEYYSKAEPSTHVLFTCMPAGKASPALWQIYTSNISHASLLFFYVFSSFFF